MNLQRSARKSLAWERGDATPRTFDHSGWWFLILHCSDTAVMKSWDFITLVFLWASRQVERPLLLVGSTVPMSWRTS